MYLSRIKYATANRALRTVGDAGPYNCDVRSHIKCAISSLTFSGGYGIRPYRYTKNPASNSSTIHHSQPICIQSTMLSALISALVILHAASPKALLFAILMHEAAHFLTALLVFSKLPRFRISPCALILSYGDISQLHEKLLISVSGPLVNFLMWLFLPRGSILSAYSLSLCAVSLLPCSHLDGGMILRAILERFSPRASRTVMKAVSVAFTLAVLCLDCAVSLRSEPSPSLMCFTLYLILNTFT